MERDEIRLECLRLAASKSPDHGEVMSRANAYFEFVTEADSQKAPEKKVVAGTKKPAK